MFALDQESCDVITSSKQSASTSAIAVEESLISEIQQREALWNFTLAIDRRGKRTKDQLWEEVSKSMNGNVFNKFMFIEMK